MSTGKIVGLIAGGVCLFCLLFLGACGAFLFKGYKSSDADISPMVDEFFAGAERGDLGETFAKLTTEAESKKVNIEQVSAFGRTLHDRLGKLESKKLGRVHMQVKNGVSLRTLTYNATFEKDEGTIRAEAVKEVGEWRIRFINVNSPALLTSYATCSACGKSHDKTAKFCPDCGAATTVPMNVPAP